MGLLIYILFISTGNSLLNSTVKSVSGFYVHVKCCFIEINVVFSKAFIRLRVITPRKRHLMKAVT